MASRLENILGGAGAGVGGPRRASVAGIVCVVLANSCCLCVCVCFFCSLVWWIYEPRTARSLAVLQTPFSMALIARNRLCTQYCFSLGGGYVAPAPAPAPRPLLHGPAPASEEKEGFGRQGSRERTEAAAPPPASTDPFGVSATPLLNVQVCAQGRCSCCC
jgi:hypothetical protein